LLRARIGACLEKKRLRDQEVQYVAQVTRVTGAAAAAIEAGTFEATELDGVVGGGRMRLGSWRGCFRRGREVKAREAHAVAEITETDYVNQLQERARSLRARWGGQT
jgi:hypothetical protein